MPDVVIEGTAVAVREPGEVTAKDFFPVFTVAQAVERKGMVNQFIGQVLRESEDFGAIPGAGTKKVLLKPGAEKLCSIFGLSPQYVEDKIVEDWTGEAHAGESLFYYSYRCQLLRGSKFMGEAIGSCNSWESKYRYRWVPKEAAIGRADFDKLVKRGGVVRKFEPNFALDKKETSGQYGKPAEYWAMFEQAIKESRAKNVSRKMGKKEFDGWEIEMDQEQFRIPNPDVADAINTCQKMAQKRALVAAVLVVTNCSDAFTQDVEDFDFGHSDPATPLDSTEQKKVATSETKQPEQSIKRPMPVEFLTHYERILKNRTSFASVCEKISSSMVDQFGDAGSDAYVTVADAFARKFPKGTNNTDDMRECLIDLWEAAENLTSIPENA